MQQVSYDFRCETDLTMCIQCNGKGDVVGVFADGGFQGGGSLLTLHKLVQLEASKVKSF